MSLSPIDSATVQGIADLVGLLSGLLKSSQTLNRDPDVHRHASDAIESVARLIVTDILPGSIERIQDPAVRAEHRKYLAQIAAAMPQRRIPEPSDCDPSNDPSWGVTP